MALPQLSAAPAVVADTRPTWRFQISLAEDEATVVSFKKLVREAERSAQAQNGPPKGPAPLDRGGPDIEAKDGPASPPHPPPPGLGGDLAGDGLPAPANRFSSVIERIERLYTGHQSDEEEDTRQPPGAAPEEATPRHRNREDDFYDTDDSFIDDDDLDAYFSDQGEPEHQGFVVTKGAVKPRPPRAEGDGAGVVKKKKKRPRVEAAEGKERDKSKKVVKKKEAGADGDKGKPAKKTKTKEGAGKLVVADVATVKAKKDKKAGGDGPKAVKKPAKKEGQKAGASADEDAALALPAVTATPAKPTQSTGALPLAEESKGPAKSEGPEAGGVGGASKKSGKKPLLADKVQRALQVSKDREDAEAAAKREAEAKRASKKKGEGKKRKKEGDASVGPGEGSHATRTEVGGSILSATVSGVPIGLLNAEVSNARTLGSKPESKKRARAEEDSRTETEETAPAKKVKREAGEEGGDDTRSAKPRKPRATDHERLEAAIADLASSVAELCPPVGGEEAEGDGAGEEGEEGSKKRRLPGPTQAALSKVARVAGMRKGLIPPELFPRLLPIVGHVLKDTSLKVNLKRALTKALETKKGGATTPKKDGPRKSSGGTPRKKEEGAKKRGQPRESTEEPGAASPAGHHEGSRHAPAGENGAQPADEHCAQRMAEARTALEELISARIEGAQRGGEAAPSGSGSGEAGEVGFAWDHPTENALLAVSRVSREGAGEQNGQVARQLYKDLAQLWPPGCMDVAGLRNAIRRAKARADRKGGDEAVAAGGEKQGQEEAAKGGKKRKPKAAGTDGVKAGQAQDKGGGDSPTAGPSRERPGPTAAAEGQGKPRPVAEAEAAHSLPSVFKQFQGSPQPLASAVQS